MVLQIEEVPLEEDEDEDVADPQVGEYTANCVGSLVILQTGAIIDLIGIFNGVSLQILVHSLVEEEVCCNLVRSRL